MTKTKTSDEILEEVVEEELTKVKGKKIVKKKKIPSNGVDKQNEAKKKKKLKKEKLKKSSEEKKNEQDCNDDEILFPGWFIQLFDHLDYMEINDMEIYKGKEEDMNERKKSPYELERKLFLIYSSSPQKQRIWDDPKNPIVGMEGSSLAGRWKLLTMTDFANVTGVNRNTLTTWKGEKWFHEHRINLMKYIFSKRTPHVIQNLYEGAIEKDENGKVQTAAVKLYLEYIERHSQAIELTGKDGGELMPTIINIIKPEEFDESKRKSKKTDKKVD